MVDDRAYQPVRCRKCGSSMNMERAPEHDRPGPMAGRHCDAYNCTSCDQITLYVELDADEQVGSP